MNGAGFPGAGKVRKMPLRTEKIGSLGDVEVIEPCRLVMGTLEADGTHTVLTLDAPGQPARAAARRAIDCLETLPAPPSVVAIVIVAVRAAVYVTVIERRRAGDQTNTSWLAGATAAAAQRRLYPRVSGPAAPWRPRDL